MGTLYRRASGGNWYAEFTDANGKRVRKSTKTRNRQAASRVLSKWESDAHLQLHSLSPKSTGLPGLVGEYLSHLQPADRKHIEYTRTALSRLIALNGWKRSTDITQHGVESAVAKLTHPQTGKPVGLRTRAFYIGSWKAFSRWAFEVRGLLGSDPLRALKKPAVIKSRDRKRVRRFLLHSEWQYLKLTPHAILYETAIQTGLRASELRSVQLYHLSECRVCLPGEFTKNGLDAVQHVTPSLFARLQTALPFDVPEKTADMLREDLAIAKGLSGPTVADFLAYRNSRGEFLDFHSLRHTCGTWLAMRNTPIKVVQTIMRHASIVTTLDTYGHIFEGSEREAIQNFADLCE
jgi:integrase